MNFLQCTFTDLTQLHRRLVSIVMINKYQLERVDGLKNQASKHVHCQYCTTGSHKMKGAATRVCRRKLQQDGISRYVHWKRKQ